MATSPRTIRRGLPRRPGGPRWPEVDDDARPSVAVDVTPTQPGPSEPERRGATVAPVASPAASSQTAAEPAEGERRAADGGRAGADAPSATASAGPGPTTSAGVTLRRGLPRVAGGEPWPPATTVAVAVAGAPAVATAPALAAPALAAPALAAPALAAPALAAPALAAPALAAPALAAPALAAPALAAPALAAPALAAPALAAPALAAPALAAPALAAPAPSETAPSAAAPSVGPAVAAPAVPGAPTLAAPAPAAPAPVAAASAAPTVAEPAPSAPARAASAPAASEPRTLGSRVLGSRIPRTRGAVVRLATLGVIGVVAAAGVIVLAARGVTTLPGVPEFVERYPGTVDPPAFAPVGFPVWMNWMHYLNFFFMALIVRSGLQVRLQHKPPAYWTPRRGGTKVSLTLWLHTSLDLLWLANGAAFVVMLFATGHWARIVPTSWAVFPNALSAALQYLTLDWPVEHGWVAYNSLQQLMYFLVVFVAAPLAALTGVRMSAWWPTKAERLNRWYPAPLARAIHFPTMQFFVLFVIAHVFLVFATGARRNLNHMFASSDAVSWAGFGWFAAGLGVVVAVSLAARPLVIAPVASLFGKVSGR
ncbi:cytochrome b/b6 domain-containing protein [Xylanimonas ulmi]|uniref:Thiosulfate reductase cytochrome b subunit n=1 Tax=Xylanimonas ulmi TaxID=228973 RepID=A0A4V2EY25_9MICO|nr:cytochrome b/b6 domain-containing protein [Xylanibacterium ulmi]RZS61510.1 thiosulfate reductase cytochrome b subunit [Xylanibacterium ulmi]